MNEKSERDEAAALEVERQRLVQLLQRWMPAEGMRESGLPGLGFARANSTHSCVSSVYDPSLGFIVQGSKALQLGDKQIVYEPLSYLASSVHLPVQGQIVGASEAEPYLAIKLSVDPQEVTDLVIEMGDRAPTFDPDMPCPEISCGLCMAKMDLEMLGAITRLVELLDRPADAPVLTPLIRREILYRALMGEMGPRMRKFALADSQANRVSRVIAVLRDRFTEPLRVSDLAGLANMSESSLYHSFKQVTRMSPLQFQKKLRLHEARRLMLSEGLEAASASYRVGYESPSHFSREYSRMFGAPPRADVNKLRGEQRESA